MFAQGQKVGEMTLVYAIENNKVKFRVDNTESGKKIYIQK